MQGENEVWVLSIVVESDLIGQLVARSSAAVRDKAIKWYVCNSGVAGMVDPAERHNVLEKIERHIKGGAAYLSAYSLEAESVGEV